MELNTHNAEILLSAANKSHYPQDELPEIALAGRSNVGKSSFINTMLNRKNLARTSGKPGKTQLLNFFNIVDKLRVRRIRHHELDWLRAEARRPHQAHGPDHAD